MVIAKTFTIAIFAAGDKTCEEVYRSRVAKLRKNVTTIDKLLLINIKEWSRVWNC